jgi:ABC-type nitrate/sulfonate/bicarbonate transport system substrate-binding protein
MNDSVGNSPVPPALAWVNGSDAPEKSSLDLGFMALTDCASLVVAATQGFAQPYGLTLNLKRQTSWANLRDKLVSGELDAAHSLYGLIYAVHLGIGGVAPSPMAVLMGLNQNGQSINLSRGLQQQGVITPEALERHVHQSRTKLTFAQTFPTGTHAMWLYYWLASQGIHPLRDVDSVVVPPPQMVAHLQAGRIDGLCVGEPWCASAVKQNQGFTLATSQSIWPNHPEKVLGCTQAFVDQYPNTARVLVMAILEASRFIEASTQNRRSTAQLLSAREYLDAPLDCIEPRLLGNYEDGLGNQWQDPHARRHVVHDPVPPLGPVARRPGLPRRCPPGATTGCVPSSRQRRRRPDPCRRHAQQPVDRRHGLGRLRPRRLCPQLPSARHGGRHQPPSAALTGARPCCESC